MALPLFRRCSRFTRSNFPLLFQNKAPVLSRCVTLRLAAPLRANSSTKFSLIGIPNPFLWLRTRILYLVIRIRFDKEFTIDEFTDGARQALLHVSKLLSQCQFDALEGLVEKDLVPKLREKCSLLAPNYKKALFVDPDNILHTIPGDMEIFSDDNGRTFVVIVMRFLYLTSAQIPEHRIDGVRIFKIQMGDKENKVETQRLLMAVYQFQREFTEGVPANWTITRIEHSNFLD